MKYCILFALASVLAPSIAHADLPLGFRDASTEPPTDYDCTVETIDDLTCELTCDGPSSDFECFCDEDLCECVDSSMGEFTMEPDLDEGAWCDQLRRGGGHYHECCMWNGNACAKYCTDKAPPPSTECSPCLYGCTGGQCN